jgi:type II secretory pathway component PulC
VIIATVALCFLLTLYYGRLLRRGPFFASEQPGSSKSVGEPAQSSSSPTGLTWLAFQSRPDQQASKVAGQLSPDRYRLAGTFFLEGAGESQRRAIVDDIAKRYQAIVSEGDRLDDAVVEKVFRDHIILQTGSGSRELWIEFTPVITDIRMAVNTNQVTAQSGSTNKFGCIQVQENRWRFSRKPILDYYQELLDEPDRMVAVFDTMKPVRDEQNKITGYVVGIEGEKDFFEAMGLRQGDIVRSVNSFPMTNRRRAEAFIDQFLKNQMNVIVLDVERGGQTVKQVYQVQP